MLLIVSLLLIIFTMVDIALFIILMAGLLLFTANSLDTRQYLED